MFAALPLSAKLMYAATCRNWRDIIFSPAADKLFWGQEVLLPCHAFSTSTCEGVMVLVAARICLPFQSLFCAYMFLQGQSVGVKSAARARIRVLGQTNERPHLFPMHESLDGLTLTSITD